MNVEAASPPLPSSALRVAFLRSFPGIGELRARQLISRFGHALSDILEDEVAVREQLVPELDARRGPAATRIAFSMHIRWKSSVEAYKVYSWLEGHGVAEPSIARHMVDLCGADALDILQSNPYALSRSLPWRTVDKMGTAVLAFRMSRALVPQAPQRLIGACHRVMGDFVDRGDTAVRYEAFVSAVADRLKFPRDSSVPARAIELALRNRRLVAVGDLLRSPGCAWMERSIARRLAAWATEPSGIEAAETERRRIVLQPGLHPEQAASVMQILRKRFSILAGGAGTGKTTTLRAVSEAWEALGGRVQLATLSGKAAMRLAQATQRPAKTIHRTLNELSLSEARPTSGAQARPSSARLDRSTLFIVDEASMVDLGQWMQITEGVERSGASLLMAGDSAQLPPIGPGLVFHECCERPGWTTTLSSIHRQSQSSGIPAVAADLRLRVLPSLPRYRGPADGVFLLNCPREEVEEVAERVVGELGDFSTDNHDLQLISARNETVMRLNRRFHDRRRRGAEEIRGHFGTLFAVGDPVVHLENDYKSGLLNGMLGHVVRINASKKTVVARFQARDYVFPAGRIGRLALAYSLTCHKLQGSQAKCVVIVVEPTKLIDPSWLYTAVTRAEKQAIVLGPAHALADAMRRIPAHKSRLTAFALELDEEKHGNGC